MKVILTSGFFFFLSNNFFIIFLCIAAYCLWPKPYFVALKDNANIYVTIGNENVELQDIKIHPEWKFNRENYDADVAVVTFFNPVKISNVVQPICLPAHAPGVIVANNGVVVSYLRSFQKT